MKPILNNLFQKQKRRKHFPAYYGLFTGYHYRDTQTRKRQYKKTIDQYPS